MHRVAGDTWKWMGGRPYIVSLLKLTFRSRRTSISAESVQTEELLLKWCRFRNALAGFTAPPQLSPVVVLLLLSVLLRFTLWVVPLPLLTIPVFCKHIDKKIHFQNDSSSSSLSVYVQPLSHIRLYTTSLQAKGEDKPAHYSPRCSS